MAFTVFRLRPEDHYLHLPIRDTDPESDEMWYVTVSAESGSRQTRIGEFYIGVTPGPADYYCPLDLSRYSESEFRLECTDENVPDDLFDGVMTGGPVTERRDLYPDLFREEQRQQFHFTSPRGWINDPNGLFLSDGVYHLGYQHNPFGRLHGGVNGGWGLATTPDGIRFSYWPEAITPKDSLTHVASGTALVDKDNLSQLGPDTVLACFTLLESRQAKGRKSIGTRGQYLAYSRDGGYSFHPFDFNPIIKVPEPCCWRDPKLVRCDDGTMCIVVYESVGPENCFSFYTSSNLKDWTFRSRIFGFYECPDLFPLTVSETGERRWVLYGADGNYRLGNFRDGIFAATGETGSLDYGEHAYAGQTFNDPSDESERIHVAWLCDPDLMDNRYRNVGFSQSMTVFCRLSLHRTESGIRLFRTPIPALETLRKAAVTAIHVSLSGSEGTSVSSLPLIVPSDTVLSIRADEPIHVTVCGKGFEYRPHTRELIFTGGKAYSLSGFTSGNDHTLPIRILTDRRSVEFFIGDEISATYAVGDARKMLCLSSSESEIELTEYPLASMYS